MAKYPPFTDVTTVACVGVGTIGGGWAAYFLSRGLRVQAWDPSPDAEEKLRALIDAAWPALTALGLSQGADKDNFTVHADLAEAVAGVGFVQESAPEVLELKQDLLARLAAATAEDVVIGSSTSGYGMTEMSITAEDPSRLVVGHPFNPPYLIPLVEVVGGEATDKQATEWASGWYDFIGKSVITMEREIPGFIANRLQEALWREALHMVDNGEATVEQIDTAITEGPGLRWPLQGPMLTFHLAGGQGGMKHMLDHFGPSLKSPWTRLEAPELTAKLSQDVIDGCNEEADGRSIDELIAQRDAGIIAIRQAMAGLNAAAAVPKP
ncbi:MAG: 3-hydroxyacyl-CoA dehydrogenase NAD-binding domain-containing protein [Micrococcaceae bacterium]|nr:3-hydroxyacyl-CoA dehydrogenase NAD-binding domain-containing protein [Micrococcaceae bacterium]